MGRLADALAFFVGKGYSREQAAGIVGNLHGESNLDTGAVGDGGKAYGLAQWHPDRQGIFQKIFGKNIRQSTFQEQLEFVHYELNNNEKRAGNMLKMAGTVEEATRTFMKEYERPANMSSYGARVNAARGAIGGGGVVGTIRDAEQSALDAIGLDGEWWTDPNASLTELDPTGITGWIKSFFTGEMAARFSAVIIGFLLIGVALVAFIMVGGNPAKVVKDQLGKVTA